MLVRSRGGGALCRSPEHSRDRDQPECFAKACSMWSRKPIPEFTVMDWDPEVWAAWDVTTAEAVGNRADTLPPSSESAIWMVVSLVWRTSWQDLVDILAGLWGGIGSGDGENNAGCLVWWGFWMDGGASPLSDLEKFDKAASIRIA